MGFFILKTGLTILDRPLILHLNCTNKFVQSDYLGSTLFFVSRASMVRGRSPEEEAIPKAAMNTLVMFNMYLNGFKRVKKTGREALVKERY